MAAHSRLSLAALALAALAAAPSAAEDDAEDDAGGGRWSVGVGAAAFTSPYAGVDDTVTPIPYLSYERGRFSVSPFGLDVALFENERVSVGVVLAPRFQPVDFEDEASLAGMESRETTAEAGVRVAVRPGFGEVRLQALADVLGEHEGQEVSLGYGFTVAMGDLTATPSVRAAWQSEELVDYYYGVKPSEARAGRPAYAADAAVIPSIGLDLSYPLGPRLEAVAFTSYEFYPAEITDSPIIDDDGAGQVIIGAIYTF